MQQTALNLDGSSRGQLAGQLIPAGVPGRPLAAPTKPINSHDPITSATPSKIPRRPSRGPSISQLFPPFRTIECVDAGDVSSIGMFKMDRKQIFLSFRMQAENCTFSERRNIFFRNKFFEEFSFSGASLSIFLQKSAKRNSHRAVGEETKGRKRERGIPFRMFRTSSKFFVERIGGRGRICDDRGRGKNCGTRWLVCAVRRIN